MTCQACVIGACDDHRRPPVCVCTRPRFDGPCNCDRDHVPDECRGCHRPYKPQVPGFDDCRRAWLAQLGAAA